MKAIRVSQFGGPEVLKLQDVPALIPGPNEILVRVEAIGVNPVDTYIRSGSYTPALALPYTPGFDAAGTVEAIGPSVTDAIAGERVYCAGTISGAYAELALCRPNQVHPLPHPLTFSQGAGIGTPYATAYRALFQRAKTVPGEFVLIHGASGGVGLAATQIARAAGLRIIATAGSNQGRGLVQQQGAHHVLDHHHAGYLDDIMRLTQDRGVDVILEMLANINLANDLTLLARGGRVVVIGSRGKVEITPRDAMSRDAAILGMALFNATEADLASIHSALRAGLENQTLRPIVRREFPLSAADQAHEAVMQPGAFGKIVLVPKG